MQFFSKLLLAFIGFSSCVTMIHAGKQKNALRPSFYWQPTTPEETRKIHKRRLKAQKKYILHKRRKARHEAKERELRRLVIVLRTIKNQR